MRISDWSSDVCSSDLTQAVYRRVLQDIEAQANLKLRVITDIIAGASAGGINGIFLVQAVETGQSLDPLTDLWLENADVDLLLDPDARPISTFTKFWPEPLVWMEARTPENTSDRADATSEKSSEGQDWNSRGRERG